MCGICGVIQVHGSPRRVIEPAVLDHMTDAMRHRGPSDRGTYHADGVALGVRRLSIVDVEGGHQPVANEDETVWAIQNGELYNHVHLRRELESAGHAFASRCDTEVLPHLFERDRENLPAQLRGKFAVAAWDGRRRQALLARDPLGVKPLYYAQVDDVVVFASELKSLLASGLIEPQLDFEAIDSYLVLGYVPAPRTPVSGVCKLPPGHRITIGDGRLAVEPYWRYPRPVDDPRPRTEEEWAAELLERLDEAVRLRLMSDVPLGAMLSGGLDSSVVVALMRRHMDEPVKTFSVGFAGAGEANELGDARVVAEAFGTEHHELELQPDEQHVDLGELVWWLDEPLADLSALGFFHLSRLAAEHVVVALSGQGADELLGGYLKHRAASLSGRLPRPLAAAAGSVAVRGPRRLQRTGRTLRASTAADRLLALSGKLDETTRRRLVRGPLAEFDGRSAARAVAAAANGVSADPLAETLYLDAQFGLPDDMLHYFDRASMAHSLEVRVPFLDHHFVEFCARIPTEYKVRRGVGKHVLRMAAQGLVPERVLEKRKQGFFRGSLDVWLRGQADGAISEWLLRPDPHYASFLDPGEVGRLVKAHQEGRDRWNTHLLLSILMLEVWLASFLPRAVSASPVMTRVAS